jgi:aminopeptidase N
VRDFALAIGHFQIARQVIDLPHPVTVSVGVEDGLGPSAETFLAKETRSLRDISRRYGPYPWSTFTLAVVPDLDGAGIEYPTIVFQGPTSLSRATSHEATHQWFYSLVGNNQARDPWLDEALASWGGAREDGSLGFFLAVPAPAVARGHLGAPMTYWDDHSESDYFAGVYAQGVRALHSLGPPERVDCALRFYASKEAFDIATPADFLAAMRRIFPRALDPRSLWSSLETVKEADP